MSLWAIGAIFSATLGAVAVVFFVYRSRAEMLESIAREFGSNASVTWGDFSDPVITFDHEGRRFVGEVRIRKYATDYVMTFEVPSKEQKLLIRHDVPFAGTYYRSKDVPEPGAKWHRDSTSFLAEKFILYSSDMAYLTMLLSDAKIFSELAKYEGATGRFLEISIDEGVFEVMFHCSGWNKYQKFRDVCVTVTIFFDRIAASN